MNEWIEKSIELANSPGYLDKLSKVYPVAIEKERPLDKPIKEKLKSLFDKKDNIGLIKTLISLPKFPIKDPYVAFFRRNPNSLETNPETAKRIANRMYDIGFDVMISGIEEPKEFNRQMGVLFKKFLPKLGYPILQKFQFEKCKDICLLEGSDSYLENYANTILKCELRKGLDILAKVNEKFVIGETKFLTDFGGHQNAQFQDGLNLIDSSEGNAIRIAIFDGVVWIKGNNKMHRRIKEVDGIALSAVLLKDFIESLK